MSEWILHVQDLIDDVATVGTQTLLKAGIPVPNCDGLAVFCRAAMDVCYDSAFDGDVVDRRRETIPPTCWGGMIRMCTIRTSLGIT